MIRSLENQGIQVCVAEADVGNLDQLKSAFKKISPKHTLKGTFHCAMVLDDAFISQMNVQRVETVMHPKVAGCWNLHYLSEGIQLDYFVLYSSISALIGNPGQSNYAAANSFLDAFAGYRRKLGLSALSINWGAIGKIGIAARNSQFPTRLENSGISSIAPEQAFFQALEILLRQPDAQYRDHGCSVAAPFATLPELKTSSMFSELMTAQSDMAPSDFRLALKNMWTKKPVFSFGWFYRRESRTYSENGFKKDRI